MQERASIVPAEIQYHSRRDDAHHRVYVHRSEEAILVTDNHQVDRNFIQEESFAHLQRSRMQYIHLGVLQVRIQILHRQYEGTMALVVFRDNRWQGDQAILATMEVDLTRGSQKIYVIPEVMMTIGDFYRNIQISILTRGYEAWQNSEANLLITRGMVGRLSNTPNVGFAYEVQGVVDYLTSHGVNALPGRRLSTRSLQGLNWVINPTQISMPMQPVEVNSQTMMDGRISLSFNNYTAAPTPEQPKYNDKDEEILAVLIETKPGVYVYYDGEADDYCKEQKSKYKTGRWDTLGQPSGKFDYYSQVKGNRRDLNISASHAAVIEPYGRDLIHTGLRIEIPYGYYGRLASRSGLAWKTRIEVGGGVIDSDYRGEVQVLLFNRTNLPIYISQQQKIAQLILEKIVIPEVYEVPHLSHTERGNKGFGSTEAQNQITMIPEKDQAFTSQDPRGQQPPQWDTYPDSEDNWTNPFASEGGGRQEAFIQLNPQECTKFIELVAANVEMEYPCLRRSTSIVARIAWSPCHRLSLKTTNAMVPSYCLCTMDACSCIEGCNWASGSSCCSRVYLVIPPPVKKLAVTADLKKTCRRSLSSSMKKAKREKSVVAAGSKETKREKSITVGSKKTKREKPLCRRRRRFKEICHRLL
ncbi:hypothetical protein ZIOFF_031841 [Zingiber officinale]|uniref:dUTP diphosphatase n=1 Tax=Zingiber officinale TaxID=94328 RepID=A0A8J5GHA8_ZINOF|nr:hypothetical protein ZIOFF_031841 [Zingiber officinale]